MDAKKQAGEMMKVALIASNGGHLTQVLQLLDAFEGHDIFFVTYFSTRDDEIRSIAPVHFCHNVVKRPYIFLWNIIWSFFILVKEKPEVVFSTGSEIAMPFFFWAKLLRIRSFFIETWSAVNVVSTTGRFVYRLADVFWVQWPELLPACGPKAEYHGAIL